MSGDDEKAINKRMSMYETEMSHKQDYDHVVINEDIDKCITEIKELITQKKLSII